MKKLAQSVLLIILCFAVLIAVSGFTTEDGGSGGPASEYLLTYRDDDIDIPEYNGDSLSASETLPSSYSMLSEGLLPDIRDQGNYGTCWAFAAISSVESNLIKKELATTSSINLSEFQLAYAAYNGEGQNWDPLGLCSGDYTYLTGQTEANRHNFYLQQGGNARVSLNLLTSWLGLANEATYPYKTSGITAQNNFETLYLKESGDAANVGRANDTVHVNGAYMTSNNAASAKAAIKNWITNIGAVSTSIFIDDKYMSNSNSTYGYCHYCYYDDASNDEGTNHAVSIVGWDDNIPASAFAIKGHTPNNPGGWLIRNSWDTYYNNGYFWLSYEDMSWLGASSYMFMGELAQPGERLYQYDGSASGSYIELDGSNEACIANVYTSQRDEKLISVGFSSMYMTGVDYTVYVYVNPTGSPYSSADKPATTVSGSTTYAGYYSAKLDSPVSLSDGDVFSVVVKFADPSEPGSFVLDVDYGYYNENSWIAFNTEQSAGQSFYSDTGSYWYDAADSNYSMRLKAATIPIDNVDTLSADKINDSEYKLIYNKTDELSLGDSERVTIACSQFSLNGQFLGYSCQSYTPSSISGDFSVTLNSEASSISAFLLSDKLSPLYVSLPISLAE